MSAPAVAETGPLPGGSFWKRRVVAPLEGQLRQGITPEKIALTIALGVVLGIFPILGSTTILCGLTAYGLRLNQPIIHLVHYFAYPAQVALLIPFYRAGSSFFGQPHIPLSVSYLIARFRADTWQFLRDFGMIGVRGIVVWCLVAPLLATAVYFAVRPPLRALARRTAA